MLLIIRNLICKCHWNIFCNFLDLIPKSTFGLCCSLILETITKVSTKKYTCTIISLNCVLYSYLSCLNLVKFFLCTCTQLYEEIVFLNHVIQLSKLSIHQVFKTQIDCKKFPIIKPLIKIPQNSVIFFQRDKFAI